MDVHSEANAEVILAPTKTLPASLGFASQLRPQQVEVFVNGGVAAFQRPQETIRNAAVAGNKKHHCREGGRNSLALLPPARLQQDQTEE